MSAPPWMPFYVADYLADTGHLSTVEHGAYMLLIMHYWQNGGLPADDAKLARICRLSAKDWGAIRPTIADFFDDDWRHGRIEREIADTRETMTKRSTAGRKAGLASAAARQRNVQRSLDEPNDGRSTKPATSVQRNGQRSSTPPPSPSTPSQEGGTSGNTSVAVVPLVRPPADDDEGIPAFLRRSA